MKPKWKKEKPLKMVSKLCKLKLKLKYNYVFMIIVENVII